MEWSLSTIPGSVMDGRAASFSGTNRRPRRQAVIGVADSNQQVASGYGGAAGSGVGDGPTGGGGTFQGENRWCAGGGGRAEAK